MAGRMSLPNFSLVGQKFHRLTVLENTGTKTKSHQRLWRCVCDCGNEVRQTTRALRYGAVKSCGCAKKEAARRNGIASGKHLSSGSRLYHIWRGMKIRCKNEKHTHYDRYGGRGITICEEWELDFSAFQNWALSSGYREGLFLDRKNNDDGYSPENCRWATNTEQQRNRSSNILIEGKTIADWAEDAVVPYATFHARLFRYKWPLEKALKTPSLGSKKHGR